MMQTGIFTGYFPYGLDETAKKIRALDFNTVQLDMIVGASAPEPVIDLLKKLEGSPLFSGTALISSQPPSQNEPLYRYRVSVSYAQKL